MNVENKVNIGCNILTHLIQHKDDLILASLFLNKVIEACEAFLLVLCTREIDFLETCTIREIGRKNTGSETCRNKIGSKVIGFDGFPCLALLGFNKTAELFVLAFVVKHVDEGHDLLIGRFGDAKELQCLVIDYVTNIGNLTGNGLGAEVEHDHLRIMA